MCQSADSADVRRDLVDEEDRHILTPSSEQMWHDLRVISFEYNKLLELRKELRGGSP